MSGLQEHYRKLENMYLAAPTSRFYQNSSIKVSEGQAEISLPIREAYFHAAGAVHGSVYFRMMDDAAYFAASSAVPDVFILTATFNIEFIRPVSEGKITAIGKLTSQSDDRLTAEAALLNEAGKEVARGSGTFARSKRELSAELGYQ